MKKVLIRAGMLPFDNKSAEELIQFNTIASNVGNLLYQTSVIKTIMTDDSMQLDAVSFPSMQTFDYESINEEYDCFVIPLANAFRPSFIAELNRITDLVKNLTIPCIVVGVGTDGIIGGDVSVSSNENNIQSVKNFMDAVLEKSNMVGVRGKTTAAFLTSLGYAEEEDFTIIGCPSMFFHGDKLPDNSRDELTYSSRIAVSRKNNTGANLHRFMQAQMERFQDHWFIPQTMPDYRLLYAGVPYTTASGFREKPSENYPTEWDAPIFREDRVLCFLNQKTWMDFLKDCDFCFGSRIHGNIAGTISGTPSFIFAPDSRVLELAEYHNLPHMLADQVDRDTDLIKIYNETDFSCIHEGHKDRFRHYIDFLHKNQLPTIYDEEFSFTKTPFDKRFEAVDFNGPIHSFASCSENERMERLSRYYAILENNRKKDISNLKKQIKTLKKDLKKARTVPPKKPFHVRLKRKIKRMLTSNQ